MGLSRSSAEAVPSAAGRGRASSGNWNTAGYRLPGEPPGRGARPAPAPRCEGFSWPFGAEALEGMQGISRMSRGQEVPAIPAWRLPVHLPSSQSAFFLFREILPSQKSSLTLPPGLCQWWGLGSSAAQEAEPLSVGRQR